MDRDSIIRSYVERITALEATRREALTSGDLREVALEMGMSQEDLAAADAARRAHLERGRGFARHRQWNDAITELRDALAFEPMDVETLHALATAYRDRWRERGYPADREEAAMLSRRVLDIDPQHEQSFALLGELDRRAATPDATRSRALRMFMALVLVIVAGLGLLLLDARQGSDPDPRPIGGEVPQSGGIPVELAETARSSEVAFTTINSSATADEYDLLGVIHSSRALDLVTLKCELLDARGRLIKSENIAATAPREGSTALEIRVRSHGLARPIARVRLWIADLQWLGESR